MKKGLIILDFNRTLYDPENKVLFNGVMEFLQDYSNAYHLAIIGKGDEKRAALIDELGIRGYFGYINLIEEKEEKIFMDCIKGFKVNRSNIWSIGDRIKKEIAVSNRLGLNTIWFRNGKFAAELPETDSEKPLFIVNNFTEIKDIIPL